MQDVLIYSQERDRKAKVSSTSIIEELGQINYIFSDKTGTLTRNVMEFKFMQVGNVLYGKTHELNFDTEAKARGKPPVYVDDVAGNKLSFES